MCQYSIYRVFTDKEIGIAVWRDPPFHWRICICNLRVLLKGNVCCDQRSVGLLLEIVLFFVGGMLSGIQVKKMSSPRELYLECLDDNLRQIFIPKIGYKFSMDSRTKAAQATINAFSRSNVKPVSNNSHGPYSESDSDCCEDQVVSFQVLLY